MIEYGSFNLIYQNSDDCVHTPPRGHKRVHSLEGEHVSTTTPFSSSTIQPKGCSLLFPGVKKKKTTEEKKVRLNKERVVSNSTPDIIIRQIYFPKVNFKMVIEQMKVLRYIPPNAGVSFPLLEKCDGLLGAEIPLLLFLFDSSNLSYLKFYELFYEKNIQIIGITPEYRYYNNQSYPIILDTNGKVSKALNIRNPLGGGIYPIPSMFLFDRHKQELMRIKLGYDQGVFYDSSLKNNLLSVLMACVDYTLKI